MINNGNLINFINEIANTYSNDEVVRNDGVYSAPFSFFPFFTFALPIASIHGQHLTYMDGGNADNAGAVICPPSMAVVLNNSLWFVVG